MAVYEVASLSLGVEDPIGKDYTVFIAGAPLWDIFTGGTSSAVFNDDDPLTTTFNEIRDSYSAAGIYIADNGDIPVNAEVTQVMLRLLPEGFIMNSGLVGDFIRPITAKNPENGTGPALVYLLHPELVASYPDFNEDAPNLVLATNTDGEAWTRQNVFNDRFGLYSQVTSGVGSANQIQVGEMRVRITFVMQAPLVSTGIPRANGLLVSLRATVDPNNATTAFPVTVRFRYGTQVDESDWIAGPTCNPESGLGSRIVSATIVDDLISGQTYYFRAYADYDDGTVLASNISSFTPIQDDRIMAVL